MPNVFPVTTLLDEILEEIQFDYGYDSNLYAYVKKRKEQLKQYMLVEPKELCDVSCPAKQNCPYKAEGEMCECPKQETTKEIFHCVECGEEITEKQYMQQMELCNSCYDTHYEDSDIEY